MKHPPRPAEYTVTSAQRREPPHIQFVIIDDGLSHYRVHFTADGTWTVGRNTDVPLSKMERTDLIKACALFMIQNFGATA